MAIRWQSDGNQMAIRWQSYRSAIPTKLNHNYTHLPALLLPCLPMTSRMQSRPPRHDHNQTPLTRSSRHAITRSTSRRLFACRCTCRCAIASSWRAADVQSAAQSDVVIRNSNQRSSRKGKSLKSDRMRGVPADARSSVLNLSSTRPFNASECRLQSQSNHHMRRKYHNHTPAEVRSSSKRRLSSSRHAATLRLLCS